VEKAFNTLSSAGRNFVKMALIFWAATFNATASSWPISETLQHSNVNVIMAIFNSSMLHNVLTMCWQHKQKNLNNTQDDDNNNNNNSTVTDAAGATTTTTWTPYTQFLLHPFNSLISNLNKPLPES